MSFFKSRFFIFCLIAAILLTLVPTLIAAFGGTDMLRATLGTVAKPFTFCASSVANAFNGFVNVFTEYDDLKQENEKLKSELKEYKEKEYSEQLLKEQNSWLKDYINLHDASPSFAFTDARVISRESGNYSTVLTLNRGSIHGVKKNMSVLTDDGLVGYVNELGLDWCKIEILTESTNSIGVYIERNGALGVLEGNAELRRDGFCKITYVSGSELQLGDKVYTTGGPNSIYPSGILVGTVDSSIEGDATTGEMFAIVKPSVDFTNLESLTRVFILLGYENGES